MQIQEFDGHQKSWVPGRGPDHMTTYIGEAHHHSCRLGQATYQLVIELEMQRSSGLRGELRRQISVLVAVWLMCTLKTSGKSIIVLHAVLSL